MLLFSCLISCAGNPNADRAVDTALAGVRVAGAAAVAPDTSIRAVDTALAVEPDTSIHAEKPVAPMPPPALLPTSKAPSGTFPRASLRATGLDTMRQNVTTTVRIVLQRITPTHLDKEPVSLEPGHIHVFTPVADTTTVCVSGADSTDFRIRSFVPSNRHDLACGTQMVNKGDDPTPWSFSVEPFVRGNRTVIIQVLAEHASGPPSVEFDTTYAIHVDIGPKCYGSGCAWYQRWFDIAMGSEGVVKQVTTFVVTLTALAAALAAAGVAIRGFVGRPNKGNS